MKFLKYLFIILLSFPIALVQSNAQGFIDPDAIEYAPGENYVFFSDANGIYGHTPVIDLVPVMFSDLAKVSNIRLDGTDLKYDLVDIRDGSLITPIEIPLISLVNDADADPTNENITQLVLRTGGANPGQTVFEIHEDGQIWTMDFSPLQDGVDDADNDPFNELTQSINLVGNELRLVNQPLGLPLSADLSSLQEDYTFVKKITSLSDTSNLVCDSIFLDAAFIGISCDTSFVRNTNTNTSILTQDYTADAAHTQSFENFGQTWNNLGSWNIDQSNSLFPGFWSTMDIVNGGFNVLSNGAPGVSTELISKPNEFGFIGFSGTESAKLHYLPAGQLVLEKTTTTASGDNVSLVLQNGEIGLNFGVDSDFKIDGDNGTLDQVFSSNGANAPPSWKDIPSTPDEWEIVEHFNTNFDPSVDYTGTKEFITVINSLATPFDVINLAGDDITVSQNHKVNLSLYDGSWYGSESQSGGNVVPITATKTDGGNLYWDGTQFIFNDTEILPLNGDISPDGNVRNSYQLRTSVAASQNVNAPVNYTDGDLLEIQLRSQSGVARSIVFNPVYKNQDGTDIGTIQLPPLEEHKLFFTRSRSSGANTWHLLYSSISTSGGGTTTVNGTLGNEERMWYDQLTGEIRSEQIFDAGANNDVTPSAVVSNTYRLTTSVATTQNVNLPIGYSEEDELVIHLNSQSGVARSIVFNPVFKNPDGTDIGTIQLPPLEDHVLRFIRSRSTSPITWHLMYSSLATQAPVAATFGDSYNVFESLAIQTNTTTAFTTALSGTTTTLSPGKYKISINYGWNHDNLSSDFHSRFFFDGNAIGVMPDGTIHRAEPKDVAGAAGDQYPGTGSDQGYSFNKVFYFTVATAGTFPILLEYRSTVAPNESSLWETSVEVFKVSN